MGSCNFSSFWPFSLTMQMLESVPKLPMFLFLLSKKTLHQFFSCSLFWSQSHPSLALYIDTEQGHAKTFYLFYYVFGDVSSLVNSIMCIKFHDILDQGPRLRTLWLKGKFVQKNKQGISIQTIPR